MAAIFQKVYDGALDVARILAKMTILKHLRIELIHREDSQPWHMNGQDLSLLQHQKAVEEADEHNVWSPRPSRPGTPQNNSVKAHQAATEEPVILTGEPAIVLARDQQDQLCFATTITSRLVDCCNNAAQAKQNLESKKETLAKLERREIALKRLYREWMVVSNEPRDDPESTQNQEIVRRKLEELGETKELFNNQLFVYENNLTFAKNKIHTLLGNTLREANILKPVVLESDGRFDFSEVQLDDLKEDPQLRELHEPEPELSEEEKEKADARMAYLHARNFYMDVERHFESMEIYERENLEDYLEAVAQGTAEETRSEHDVQAIRDKMQLTGDLIEAEMAFNAAKEKVKNLGLSVEDCNEEDNDGMGWDVGESTVTGRELPPGLDPDQTDARDFEDPMNETQRAGVDKWLGRVDKDANPEQMAVPEDSLLDDLRLQEPEMFESVSMVDFGPTGLQIGQWQTMCEEQRQQWREDYPVGSPREKYGHPLKRRMSC